MAAATEWIQERVAQLTPEETEQRSTTPNLVETTRHQQSTRLVQPVR
jgi:hypothetical protein